MAELEELDLVSHVFPVAGHPLHLTSPESGGAEFGVECAGLNQRKTEDSGWRHRGRSKAKDTGLLFLLRKNFFF